VKGSYATSAASRTSAGCAQRSVITSCWIATARLIGSSSIDSAADRSSSGQQQRSAQNRPASRLLRGAVGLPGVCDHHGVSYFDRLRSWRCWCVSFGGRPNLTPRPLARVRPSPVRARISSRSNSARPPSTVSISRPCGVGPFADCFPQPLARGPLEVVNLIQTRSPDGRILTETSRRR